jgi:hypothetical protein
MTNNAPIFQKNSYIVDSDKINITFDKILEISDSEFAAWIDLLRNTMVEIWDKHGLIPSAGITEDKVEKEFQQLSVADASNILRYDELVFEYDVIDNSSKLGTAANWFFPTMLKTKTKSNSGAESESVYDRLKEEGQFDSFVKEKKRHLKQDAFHAYSNYVKKDDSQNSLFLVAGDNAGKSWIEQFTKTSPKEYDFFLEPKEKNQRGNVVLKEKDYKKFKESGVLKPIHLANLPDNTDGMSFHIRLYKKGQKLFPKAFRSFKSGRAQAPTNFPPMVAKYLYEKFTEEFKDQDKIVVYDPSAGWGGRITGAMAVKADRKIHYIGTDPNPDLWMEDEQMMRHELLARYFNQCIFRKHKNTYQLFRHGSEEIHKDKDFKKWKGKVDFVFSSPPYFAKEIYSNDEGQSYKKFPTYAEWRDGFLRQTLKTAVEWLKTGGYLAWNIADIQYNNTIAPLEYDSRQILRDLGMTEVTTLKMALTRSPGSNRKDKNYKPTFKNFCQISGAIRKYEPVFIFKKEF